LERRLIANELILSFVSDGEQRTWRNMTRMKTQDRVRLQLQNQMECLLEEMRIKLSSVVARRQRASHSACCGRRRDRPQEIGDLGRRPVKVQRRATRRCFDGKPAADLPENARAATGAAPADRYANREAQRYFTVRISRTTRHLQPHSESVAPSADSRSFCGINIW